MLIVVSILGVLLVFSAPSFMQMRMSQQANQALYTLRAIQNAEAYYLQIYHNGYVDPGVLTGTGIAVPPTCDAPLLLGEHKRKLKIMATSFNSHPTRLGGTETNREVLSPMLSDEGRLPQSAR